MKLGYTDWLTGLLLLLALVVYSTAFAAPPF